MYNHQKLPFIKSCRNLSVLICVLGSLSGCYQEAPPVEVEPLGQELVKAKSIEPELVALTRTLVLKTVPKPLVEAGAFQNPPNEFRITQYQLTPDRLLKYQQYGIGGTMAFFYSMLYPESKREHYKMGKAGPAIIGRMVDSAVANNYKVWMADDWGYPSGMAGGRVVAENPDYEVKGLTMLTVAGEGRVKINYALPQDLHDIVAATLYPVRNGGIDLNAGRSLRFTAREVLATGPVNKWQIRIFARYIRNKDTQAQSTKPQFGHTGRYPDLMNREAVSRFIANMHEPILAQINDPASKVEGFYTNEPNLMQSHWKAGTRAAYACVPWSDDLATLFERMHHYPITQILPALFEGTDDASRRGRLHYRQAVAELFTDSYARQIRNWCHARGVKSSGHFLRNDDLSMHAQGYGDMMKFVSEFDVPALDIPIPNPDQFRSFSYQQTRIFSSAAAWKQRNSTIMLLDPIIGGYGLTRLSPDIPLLINSINMACFHGVDHFTSYLPLDPRNVKDARGRTTIAKGYTKEEYINLNEYTGRLCQILRGAKRTAAVGLYYPISMFQADLMASDKHWQKIRELHGKRQKEWELSEEALLDGDVEYMIVHPEAVAEASIEDGRMLIGDGNYRTLVMPPLDFLPIKVARKLRVFQKAGGTVIWVNQVPSGAEHERHNQAVVANLAGAQATPLANLKAVASARSPRFTLSFKPGPNQLTVGRFRNRGKRIYLLVNREQKKLGVRVQGNQAREITSAQLLDPTTGEIKTLQLPTNLQIQANRSVMLLTRP